MTTFCTTFKPSKPVYTVTETHTYSCTYTKRQRRQRRRLCPCLCPCPQPPSICVTSCDNEGSCRSCVTCGPTPVCTCCVPYPCLPVRSPSKRGPKTKETYKVSHSHTQSHRL